MLTDLGHTALVPANISNFKSGWSEMVNDLCFDLADEQWFLAWCRDHQILESASGKNLRAAYKEHDHWCKEHDLKVGIDDLAEARKTWQGRSD